MLLLINGMSNTFLKELVGNFYQYTCIRVKHKIQGYTYNYKKSLLSVTNTVILNNKKVILGEWKNEKKFKPYNRRRNNK